LREKQAQKKKGEGEKKRGGKKNLDVFPKLKTDASKKKKGQRGEMNLEACVNQPGEQSGGRGEGKREGERGKEGGGNTLG